MEGGRPNRKGRKTSGEEGKAKTEMKKIKWGRRERKGGVGIKKQKGKSKEGKEGKGRDDSTETIEK